MIWSHRSVTALVLMLGLSLAGYAVYLANELIQQIEAENTVVEEVPTRLVATFAQDLPQGHILALEDMAGMRYVETSVPSSIMLRADAVGSYVARDVRAGEPVLASLVSVDPIDPEPVLIRTRRGIEVTTTCLAFCKEGS